ncbi:hypothetical protein GGS21DRAFT_530597 [Xylaria nigripes]|nr:hypothetical protein GGS21DRAFT_530597 [Xylaria nigripes]
MHYPHVRLIGPPPIECYLFIQGTTDSIILFMPILLLFSSRCFFFSSEIICIMLRGNLSDFSRGGRATSSRASSFRGPWRGYRGFNRGGNRGDWHHDSRHNNGKDNEKVDDQVSLGPLITEFTPENTTPFVGEARIKNCSYAASYSMSDEKPFRLIVPGQPASWKPLPLPCRLPRDCGDYMRDQNGARFPNHPMQPAVQALFALDQTFDPSSIDIMGCASSLGDILRFARSIDSTFRFDAELIGNTLFLIRNHKDDVIPDVRGYGHSFLDAFTSKEPNSGIIKSHQRVVSYDFGGMKCLVRFECDGYLTNEDSNGTEPIVEIPPRISLSSIALRKAGMIVSQDSVLEIKTKSQARGAVQRSDHIPRLWLRQIPHFITAYHTQGTFQELQIEDVHKELIEWESQHQDELKMFGSILCHLITEVKRMSHLKLEVYRVGTGPLQLRERKGVARQALPRYWENRWKARLQPSLEPATVGNDSDEDSETYPSLSRASSEGSDASAADFSFDYTSCNPACGYCGHCP